MSFNALEEENEKFSNGRLLLFQDVEWFDNLFKRRYVTLGRLDGP